MATTIPGNAYIDMLINTRRNPASALRLRQLDEQGRQLDQEDYRTVGTDRGPVRGFSGGARR